MGGLSLTRIPVLPGGKDRKLNGKRSYSRNGSCMWANPYHKGSCKFTNWHRNNSDWAKYTLTSYNYQTSKQARKLMCLKWDQENVVRVSEWSGSLVLPFFLLRAQPNLEGLSSQCRLKNPPHYRTQNWPLNLLNRGGVHHTERSTILPFKEFRAEPVVCFAYFF